MGTDEALTIPGALARARRDHPSTEAVVDGHTRLTYADLGAAVDRAARAFRSHGVGRGDPVAIWAPNGLPWILAALGALSAGAVLVPLNTRYKGEEAHWILARSRARFLFVENAFLGQDYLGMLGARGTEPGVPGLPDLRSVVTFDAAPVPGALPWTGFLASGDHDPRPVPAPGPDDLSDVLFTSGTTGRPKGVMCTHAQNVRTFDAWCERTGLEHGDRYLVINPFFHCFGYKAGIVACLLRGATMVLQPVFRAEETLHLVEAERITVLPGPPTIYTTLLDTPGLAERDVSTLRLAVTGAASVPVRLVERVRTELGMHVVTAYGLTESCGTVTVCSLGDGDTTVATTSGRPIEGVDVRISDAGEVLVRGHNVMRGYLGEEAATAETVVDGWLHTGDLGRLDGNGYLTITGRLKEMFTVGGFNVYPAEVEQVLTRHPDVSEAAVVGVPDPRMGEVGRAYVTARPGTDPDRDALVAHCRERLANFKVPREVVVLDALPRNAAGKVRKVDLPTG
ncbi:AMP-binding protein [Nocardiopsis sp. HNM0947]|uniref:AMP-binding protein n=1 Tax=Nocardiopsis coralli TaxID=2772213 RepID=A0ABR9PEX5_9ACTN|nr:FadD3 family acyl-CoA ligase [Nocardiopsis coralli]MBE3002393.1 AMP-binding protein [Nocardiopsis coralli]